jgi:hypothetical protein
MAGKDYFSSIGFGENRRMQVANFRIGAIQRLEHRFSTSSALSTCREALSSGVNGFWQSLAT